MTIHYTTNESDCNVGQSIDTWQPDSSIKYLNGWHGALFAVSVGVVLLVVLPVMFASTFPKTVLRSKKLSYFFPLLAMHHTRTSIDSGLE